MQMYPPARMIYASRVARFQSHLPMMQAAYDCSWTRQTSRVTIGSSQTASHPGNKDEMPQQQQNPKEKIATEDEMAQSFGVEYATRSEEEGFGGIYGGNEFPVKENEETQKTEVKEEKKATYHPDKMATS